MEGKAGADPFIIEIILCSLFLYFETPLFTSLLYLCFIKELEAVGIVISAVASKTSK